MKQILTILALFITVVSFGQGSPTGAKTQFKNGVGIGSKDTGSFAAADSLFLTIDRSNRLWWRNNGLSGAWNRVASSSATDFIRNQIGSNLSAQSAKFRIDDTAWARMFRGAKAYVDSLQSTSSAGGRIVSNGGTIAAEWGAGGGSNFDFHGFAGYNANRSSSYTSRSFTDKNYVDSADALRVKYTDTTSLLSQVVRTYGAQSISGEKSFNNTLTVGSGISLGASTGIGSFETSTGSVGAVVGTSNSSTGFGVNAVNNSNGVGLVSSTSNNNAIRSFNNGLSPNLIVRNNGGGSLIKAIRNTTDTVFSVENTGALSSSSTGYFGSDLTSAARIRSDKAFFNSSSTGATDTVVSVVSAASGPAMVVQNSNGQAIRAQGAVTITSTGTGSLNNALDLVSSSGQRFIRANNGSSNVFTVDNGGEVAATSVVLSGNLTGTTVNLSGTFNSSVSTNADFPNIIANTSSGTSAFSTMYLSNDGSGAGALAFGAVGTGNTTGGIFPQDGAVLYAGTALSGGLSFGTRANAAARLYTNATLSQTWNTDQTTTLSSLGTGTVYSNSGTLTNTNPSDARIKNTVKPLSYGLAEILKLQPKSFYYNSDTAKKSLKYGFIAQDVKSVMPDMVRKVKGDTLGLETDGIYVTMVKAIQEQQDQIKALEARIAKLEAIITGTVRKTRR